MGPLIPAIAAAGLSAAGSFFGQSSANSANLKIAREQMAFQERLSSSSYTRARADLERAGYNPMLAVSQGGASSPAGASTHVDSPTREGVTSGLTAFMNMKQRELLTQQVGNLKQEASIRAGTGPAEIKKLLAEVEKIRADELLHLQSAKESEARAANFKADTLLKSLTAPGLLNEARMQQTIFGRVLPYVNSGAGAVRALSPLNLLRGRAKPLQGGRVTERYNARGTHIGTTYNRPEDRR